MEETKSLNVTCQEAEILLDGVRVSNPQTRTLALKLAGLVLEFAAEEAVRRAEEQAFPLPAGQVNGPNSRS